MRDRSVPKINLTTEGPLGQTNLEWGNKATTIKANEEGIRTYTFSWQLEIRFYLLCIIADLYFSAVTFRAPTYFPIKLSLVVTLSFTE